MDHTPQSQTNAGSRGNLETKQPEGRWTITDELIYNEPQNEVVLVKYLR